MALRRWVIGAETSMTRLHIAEERIRQLHGRKCLKLAKLSVFIRKKKQMKPSWRNVDLFNFKASGIPNITVCARVK